jgi:hypothetical protein
MIIKPKVPMRPPTSVMILGYLRLKTMLLTTFINKIDEKHKATNPLIKCTVER